MQIIVFTLLDKYYAICTDKVEEISRQLNYTMVPNSPDWVEGLMNLRGNVVTILNLSKLLQEDNSVCYNNIIIMQNNDEKIGIMVQDVTTVMDIEPDDIQRLGKEISDGVLGVLQLDDKIVNILDIDTLLSKNEGFI